MNTFAVLLLAFPFYLAVNGRLIAYTNLVSTAPQNAVVSSFTTAPNTVKSVAPLA